MRGFNLKHSTARALWSLVARFFSGGALCFALNLLVIRLGTEVLHFHYLLVFSVSWLLVLMLGFTIHRHWTFRSTTAPVGPQFARYVAANASQIALSYALMWALVSRLDLMPWKASCVVALIFAVFNFFIHKNWSFAPETRGKSF